MKPSEPLTTRQEIMDLLMGKPKAAVVPAGRREFRRLPGSPTDRPLTLAEQRARTRWKKPVVAIIADALASNRGLLERLGCGVYGPEMKHKEQYQVIFDGLYQTTREQITALEMFARVDWSE